MPHIVVSPKRVVVVPAEVPVEHVRAAWGAFGGHRAWFVVPNSRLIKDAGPSEYPATLSNAWKNVLAPMFGLFLKPKGVVEGFTDWEGEEMDLDGNEKEGKKGEEETTKVAIAQDTTKPLSHEIQVDVQNCESISDSNMKNLAYNMLIKDISNDGATHNLVGNSDSIKTNAGAEGEKSVDADAAMSYDELRNMIENMSKSKTKIPSLSNASASAQDQLKIGSFLITEPISVPGSFPPFFKEQVYASSDFCLEVPSLIKKECKSRDAAAAASSFVIVYKFRNTIGQAFVDVKGNVSDFVANLKLCGFDGIKVLYVFYLGRAPPKGGIAKVVHRARCADMFELADIVRELYAIKKYVDPMPPGVTSKMVKFVITRIFNALEFDAEAEIDIDDFWSVLVNTTSSQPKFSGSEFVAVLDYLGLWAGESGKIKGYKVKKEYNALRRFNHVDVELFVRRAGDPNEKVFNLLEIGKGKDKGQGEGDFCPGKILSTRL